MDYTVGETKFTLRPENKILFNEITAYINTTHRKPVVEITFDYNSIERISSDDIKNVLTKDEKELLEAHINRLTELVKTMKKGRRK